MRRSEDGVRIVMTSAPRPLDCAGLSAEECAIFVARRIPRAGPSAPRPTDTKIGMANWYLILLEQSQIRRRMTLADALLTRHGALFSSHQRVMLGLKIAKSLLDLVFIDGSSLSLDWGCKDIFFFDSNLAVPYILLGEVYNKDTDVEKGKHIGTSHLIHNPAMYRLAVVLTEISLGKTLSEIGTDGRSWPEIAADIELEQYLHLRRILESPLLREEMGGIYSKVVRRCFDWSWGSAIDGADFIAEFWEAVIEPLERWIDQWDRFGRYEAPGGDVGARP